MTRVGQRAAPHDRQAAERHADQQRGQPSADDAEDQRVGQRLHDQRRDRPVRPDVVAEIAGQRVAEEMEDLPPDRLVEAHALDEQLLQLRRGARAERDARRIAGHEEDRRIHGDHHDDEDQETETDALDGVGEHGLSAPSGEIAPDAPRCRGAVDERASFSRLEPPAQIEMRLVGGQFGARHRLRVGLAAGDRPRYSVTSLAESGSSARMLIVSVLAEETVMPRSSIALAAMVGDQRDGLQAAADIVGDGAAVEALVTGRLSEPAARSRRARSARRGRAATADEPAASACCRRSRPKASKVSAAATGSASAGWRAPA